VNESLGGCYSSERSGRRACHAAYQRAERIGLSGFSGMESGTDLEMLFLELTGGQADLEGSFVGLAASANGDATTGKGTAA
jgi:hypothetical protein